MFHRIAKGTAEAAKNFVNISATLSIRQQMRMASVYYSGLFDTASVHLPDKVTKKQDVPPGTEFYEKLCRTHQLFNKRSIYTFKDKSTGTKTKRINQKNMLICTKLILENLTCFYGNISHRH